MSSPNVALERLTWTVDPTHTTVEFAVKHMMISTVKGRFGEVEGTVAQAEDGTWTTEIQIATSSIDTRAPQRDAHLRSPDFFDAATYPTLGFRSKGIAGEFERIGDEFVLVGDLTIRGVTREVELDATYLGEGRDPWGGERLSFSATTRIDRRDFGLTWNQALETGGVLVSNEVVINLDVQLVKAEG